jgi:16S rRNA (cytosine1402-N4)-methyltransferase
MYHTPVLLTECIEGLNIEPGGVYVDLTYGGGGHSREILKKLNADGHLVAFDQDADALKNTINDERFLLLNQNFRFMKNFLRLYKLLPVSGILADLGISSHQIDSEDRGFSTRFDGPLDMRMDKSNKVSASVILNSYSEDNLREIFSTYGEISNSKLLASTIAHYVKAAPIKTTSQLKQVIGKFIPKKFENKYLAQVFQALRIEVNDELGALKTVLKQTIDVLKPGGRLAVISYQSLEDRLVKNFIRTGNFEGDIIKDFYGNVSTPFIAINRKPITPGSEEIKSNSRARSAKLRIAEKI